MREQIIMNNVDKTKMSLEVKNLYKYFGNFCAVKNLTFGIRQTDCFGLLGFFYRYKNFN